MKNSISLSKFLSRYANVDGKDLKKVRHKEVTTIFPFLKRIPSDAIKSNPGLVTSGKAILVDDGKEELYYVVPKVEYLDDRMEFHREENDNKVVLDDKVYDYTSMSIYELRCLLVRKFNSSRNQYCARHELERRGIPITKKYKRNNKILLEND